MGSTTLVGARPQARPGGVSHCWCGRQPPRVSTTRLTQSSLDNVLVVARSPRSYPVCFCVMIRRKHALALHTGVCVLAHQLAGSHAVWGSVQTITCASSSPQRPHPPWLAGWLAGSNSLPALYTRHHCQCTYTTHAAEAAAPAAPPPPSPAPHLTHGPHPSHRHRHHRLWACTRPTPFTLTTPSTTIFALHHCPIP